VTGYFFTDHFHPHKYFFSLFILVVQESIFTLYINKFFRMDDGFQKEESAWGEDPEYYNDRPGAVPPIPPLPQYPGAFGVSLGLHEEHRQTVLSKVPLW
jgi:hypothetical protein